jgi:exodeoxyribonuclease VIII
MKNVMIDLETLGNGSDAVIISIGACEFSVDEGLGRTFYMRVDPQSCVDAGLKMDVSTVMWWMQQSDQARAAFKGKGAVPLEFMLAELATWYPAGACLWGNGATFDNVILSNAYKAVKGQRPWEFWNDRCYRTLKALRPDVKMERAGTHHNALDDAKDQSVHAIALLKSLGLS